jgi:ferredoxin
MTSDGPDELHGWSIEVDPELCMGTGVCTVYAAATFSLQSPPARVSDRPGDTLDAIRTAVEACPTGAISLIPRA